MFYIPGIIWSYFKIYRVSALPKEKSSPISLGGLSYFSLLFLLYLLNDKKRKSCSPWRPFSFSLLFIIWFIALSHILINRHIILVWVLSKLFIFWTFSFFSFLGRSGSAPVSFLLTMSVRMMVMSMAVLFFSLFSFLWATIWIFRMTKK